MPLPEAFFPRIRRLPPYVLAEVNQLKLEARRRGEDIIDFGMGNPDRPTPRHIVDKLVEASTDPRNHRYSVSRGIGGLRHAICEHYARRYHVELDPERQAVVTIGTKEGLSHLLLAIAGPGDVVLAPNPTYPIHAYGVVISGADVISVPVAAGRDFFTDLEFVYTRTWPRPKAIIVSFPHNPTTIVVEKPFFERLVAFARLHGCFVIHDLAYADIVFDREFAPSILEVQGATDVAVELFSLSKAYNMAGWRVGFALGNDVLLDALRRLKGYLDYGIFQPLQIAATVALRGPQDCVREIRETYRERRDVLIDGLDRAGWKVEPPMGTMFVWAAVPEPLRHQGSLGFAKWLLSEAKVAVAPGNGFGDNGEGYVRFALVENEQRTRQACRAIRRALSSL